MITKTNKEVEPFSDYGTDYKKGRQRRRGAPSVSIDYAS